jgi:hypothetical protein
MTQYERGHAFQLPSRPTKPSRPGYPDRSGRPRKPVQCIARQTVTMIAASIAKAAAAISEYATQFGISRSPRAVPQCEKTPTWTYGFQK